MIQIDLPYPPSINTYYAVVRGRKILSKKGREYKDQVLAICLTARCNAMIKGPVFIVIEANVPDKRRRDQDNIEKPLFDSLTNAGVWVDDSQIQAHFTIWGNPKKGGWVQVTIQPIEKGVKWLFITRLCIGLMRSLLQRLLSQPD